MKGNGRDCRRRPRVNAVVCLTTLMAATTHVSAQDRRGVERSASFTAGASFGDGGTALASAIGVGIRWSSRIGADVELSHARRLDFSLELCPPPRVCVIGGRVPVTGRTVSLVSHLSVDLLPASRRLRLYALAGAGAGHVRQRYFLVPSVFGGERPELTRSSLTMAISFGGGAAFSPARRFAVGIDVRSLHLFDDHGEEARFIAPAGTLSTVRLGARAVWKF
jgi:hypothetical protein